VATVNKFIRQTGAFTAMIHLCGCSPRLHRESYRHDAHYSPYQLLSAARWYFTHQGRWANCYLNPNFLLNSRLKLNLLWYLQRRKSAVFGNNLFFIIAYDRKIR